MWEFLNGDRWIMLKNVTRSPRDMVVPLRKTPIYAVVLPQVVEMAEAGSGIDLISRALGRLRELLQSAVGIAAQVIQALVGDVVVEARRVEGQERPEMVARFTINAVPALAVLSRCKAG